MATHKRRVERNDLFGMAGAKPEWEQQRDDARDLELEKTRRLRAMRLAAQAANAAKPAAPPRVAAKPVQKPRRIARAS